MATTSEALACLMNLEIWCAVNTLYTATVGVWWTFPIYIAIIVAVGMVTQNVAAVSVFTMLTSALMIYYHYLPPFFESILYFIVVLSFGVLLYEIFGPKDE